MIYTDTTAIDAVNRGIDTPDAFYHPKHPSELIAKSKWHSTDGWRGHYELEAGPGYKVIDADWTTGDWGDGISDEQGPDATERKLKALEAEHGDIYVVYTPTSNVFSTGFDVLARDPEAKPANRGRIVAHKTRLFEEADGSFRVRYHATDVISYAAATDKYTLNTGGWATMTTAKRINEYLPRGRGYVYRKNWVMYVHSPDVERADIELKDGMEV